MFLIGRDRADEYIKRRESGVPTDAPLPLGESSVQIAVDAPGGPAGEAAPGRPAPSPAGGVAGLSWSGELPAQKWMNFYTKVLSRFATGEGMKLTVTVDVTPAGGVPKSKVDETRVALRELGLPETVPTIEPKS